MFMFNDKDELVHIDIVTGKETPTTIKEELKRKPSKKELQYEDAMELLYRGFDDKSIMYYTKLSKKELKDLKKSLDL